MCIEEREPWNEANFFFLYMLLLPRAQSPLDYTITCNVCALPINGDYALLALSGD